MPDRGRGFRGGGARECCGYKVGGARETQIKKGHKGRKKRKKTNKRVMGGKEWLSTDCPSNSPSGVTYDPC